MFSSHTIQPSSVVDELRPAFEPQTSCLFGSSQFNQLHRPLLPMQLPKLQEKGDWLNWQSVQAPHFTTDGFSNFPTTSIKSKSPNGFDTARRTSPLGNVHRCFEPHQIARSPRTCSLVEGHIRTATHMLHDVQESVREALERLGTRLRASFWFLTMLLGCCDDRWPVSHYKKEGGINSGAHV